MWDKSRGKGRGYESMTEGEDEGVVNMGDARRNSKQGECGECDRQRGMQRVCRGREVEMLSNSHERLTTRHSAVVYECEREDRA